MKIHVMGLWVITPCSDVVGYHCFGGSCFPHLEGEVNGASSWPAWTLPPSYAPCLYLCPLSSADLLHPEDGDIVAPQNVGRLPHHYMMSTQKK